MEDIISRYVLRHRFCNLPHVGTLRIADGESRLSTADKIISAPIPQIEFLPGEPDPGNLAATIAAESGVSLEEASGRLVAFCSHVQQIFGDTRVHLPGIGEFYADAEGILRFRQHDLPAEYFPAAISNKVIRPNAVHTIKVGDDEVSSSKMQGIPEKQYGKHSHRWILAAVLLSILAATTIVFYLNSSSSSGFFGNSRKFEPQTAPSTYTIK
jgi:hypothetical protein